MPAARREQTEGLPELGYGVLRSLSSSAICSRG
jgi:hypothetical protein